VRELAERVLAGDMRAAARACRLADDRAPGYEELLRELYPHGGRAWLIGVTGTPGAGKSTLSDALVAEFRARAERVAVVAIDPTSPFTGGAVLGDRIRMQRHFEDPDVFIRSLATRGALGGLTRSTRDVTLVLEAWGAGVVLVETVGVGQDELDVCRLVQTTLVVTQPGLGDDVQAVKAGILEIADVFAVNKADREGADAAVRELEQRMALGAAERAVVPTVATRGQGVPELVSALDAHRVWSTGTAEGRERHRSRAIQAFVMFLRDALADEVLASLGAEVTETAERLERREIDPYTAAGELIARFRGT
jgi:LAO/AO transport system kinase